MRHIQERDFAYLWAAYRKGKFRDMIGDNLGRAEFAESIVTILELFNHEWILEAPNLNVPSDGMVPVGIVVANGDRRFIEPHVDWFPWATDRNKVEAALAFLSRVSTQYKVLAFVRPEDKEFYIQMCRYGQLTMGCKILDYYASGEDAYFFYTRGPR